MSKFKQLVSKTWMVGAAGAMILGSGVLLDSALSQTAFAADNAHSTVQSTDHSASSSKGQSPASQQTAGGYKIVNTTQAPSPQDLSAQKAAAYAAGALKQKYGLDLTGYKVYAVFVKGAAPNTDQWGFKFVTPENAATPWTYVVGVNAVTGKVILVDKA